MTATPGSSPGRPSLQAPGYSKIRISGSCSKLYQHRGCSPWLLHRDNLHVMVVSVLNLAHVIDRFFAPAVAIARLLGNLPLAEQEQRLLDVAEPLVGIKPHFPGEVARVIDMARPAVVACQGKANSIFSADLRTVKVVGVARHHLGAR